MALLIAPAALWGFLAGALLMGAYFTEGRRFTWKPYAFGVPMLALGGFCNSVYKETM